MRGLMRFWMIALLWCVTGAAGASVTYQVVAPLYGTATVPYTTAMRITGSFTLSSALPINQSHYLIPAANITSFDFSDGVNAYTASNSNTPSIWVTTDAAGNVTLAAGQSDDAILLSSTDEFKSVMIYPQNGRASTYEPIQHSIGDANFTGSTTISLAIQQYTIGGTVTGLASGKTVVLQNNGGDNKTVAANGAFTFATAVNAGSAYAVTVLTQPTGQTCTVTNGSGTANANVTNVAVSCTTTTYTIGGTVTGLASGQSVVLQNNGGDNKTVAANSAFTFATAVNAGSAYAVTVLTQPTGQTCTVTNGSGTANANVTNVAVNCTTTTYTVGGTVTGLASGQSVVLQNNGGDNKTVVANGAFTFATAVNAGGAYAVTVLTQPTGQTCTVTNGSGTANANVTNVAVACTTSITYTIGGTISGLAYGKTMVLQNNGGDNKTIAVNGAFTFATAVNAGSAYAVTVLTQPTGQACTVTNGSGTAAANVTNVVVSCATARTLAYSVNGHTGTAPSGGTYYSGAQITVASGSALTWSATNARTAAYWTTAADGTGTRYAFGSTLTMPDGDLTLYAQWNTVSVNAQIGLTYFDVFVWSLGLSAQDGLGQQVASGRPAKHCQILNLFLCNFDSLPLSLPISPNGAVTSSMVTANMSCRYTNVTAPQTAVTIPWSYLPLVGIFNIYYPGSTTVGWSVSDAANRSFANDVRCDIGLWIVLACVPSSGGANLCATLNAGSTSGSAQSSGEARSIPVAQASSRVGSPAPVTYNATCTSPDGGATLTGSSTTNQMTIAGATPGKHYTCSFTATDGSYVSPSVDNDNGAILVTVPTNPTAVIATPGTGSIAVSFGASSGTGTIQYGVACTSSNGGATGYAAGTTSPVTVTGLTPGKSYTCTVSAQDNNGFSQTLTNANGPVVVSSEAAAAPVPVLSEWPQILLLISLIGLIGWHSRRVWR